jgi:hypothetical protein
MKKLFTWLLILSQSVFLVNAQWLPLEPFDNLTYYYQDANNKQMIIIDSMLYTCRHQGLEGLNLTTWEQDEFWSNHYPVRRIVPDTDGKYVYLKDNDFIGRYNYELQQYENIWPDTMPYTSFYDIDVSPDGTLWAVNVGNSPKVIQFDGDEWSFYPYPNYLYGGFDGMHAINDTLAYVLGGPNQFFAFHNGIYDSLFSAGEYYLKDWDADDEGNLWFAAVSKIIHISNGEVTVYDTSNSIVGDFEVSLLRIDNNGNTWASGNNNKVLKFDGNIWIEFTLPDNFTQIENFAIDDDGFPWLIAHQGDGRKLYKLTGGSWSALPFDFFPIRNATTIGLITQYSNYGYFASNQGIFKMGINSQNILNFQDSTELPLAEQATCFSENNTYPDNSPVFGTPGGIGGIYYFNNDLLPNKKVNYICHDNGTYYIATDSGLVAFNGLIYTFINTSNSPLPSDKITFVTTGHTGYYNDNGLYIGTDQGMAILKNGEWQIIDNSVIPIDNFYVTGIAPPAWNENIYIATMGNGLVILDENGDYEILSSVNGQLQDDSLTYVKFMDLFECGAYIVTGTLHHGIGYSEIWWPEYFEYITDFMGEPIINSTTAASGTWGEIYMIQTDSKFFILTPCGSTPEIKEQKQLQWFIRGEHLIVNLPETSLYKKSHFILTDILGRRVMDQQAEIDNTELALDIGKIPSGVYIFNISTGLSQGIAKVIITR